MKIKLFYQVSIVALMAATLSPSPVIASSQAGLARIGIKTNDKNTLEFLTKYPKSAQEYLAAKAVCPQLTIEYFVKCKQEGLSVDQIIAGAKAREAEKTFAELPFRNDDGNDVTQKTGNPTVEPDPGNKYESTLGLNNTELATKQRFEAIGLSEGVDLATIRKAGNWGDFVPLYKKIKSKPENKEFNGRDFIDLRSNFTADEIELIFNSGMNLYETYSTYKHNTKLKSDIIRKAKEKLQGLSHEDNSHEELSSGHDDKTGSHSPSAQNDDENPSDHEQSSSSHTTSSSEKSESVSGHSSDSSSDEGKQKFNSGNSSGAHQSNSSSSSSSSSSSTPKPAPIPTPSASSSSKNAFEEVALSAGINLTTNRRRAESAYLAATDQLKADQQNYDKTLSLQRFNAAYYLYNTDNNARELASTTITHNLVEATEKLMTGHNAIAQPTGAQIKAVLSALEKDPINGYRIANAVAWGIKNGFGRRQSNEIPQAVACYTGIKRNTGLPTFQILWNKGNQLNTGLPSDRIENSVFVTANIPEEFKGIKEEDYIVFDGLHSADETPGSKTVTIVNGAVVK